MPAELRLDEARKLLAQAVFGRGEPGFSPDLDRVEQALSIIDECCATFDWGAINQLQDQVKQHQEWIEVLSQLHWESSRQAVVAADMRDAVIALAQERGVEGEAIWRVAGAAEDQADATYEAAHGEGDVSSVRVLVEVHAERRRQNEKWGRQSHPDDDPRGWWFQDPGLAAAERRCRHFEIPGEGRAKSLCEKAAAEGTCTWPHILIEEVSEAIAAAHNPLELRGELIQVAAVATQWVEDIDLRRAAQALEVAQASVQADLGEGASE